MEKISCVLITKEKEYPQIIMDRLDLGFFDEIIVNVDCPSVYNRYLLAAQAKNDIIYVQDDDTMVNYQVLFSKYNGRITNTMTLPFQRQYEPLGCTLVGWGCYFPKSMLSVFKTYIDKYGEDEHLLREADRIFTYLNKPFNTIIQPHEDLPSTLGEDRMSSPKNLDAHFKSMNEALEKCKALSPKPINDNPLINP
jgi:hypothetical protein